jgi:hypothetical protein
MVVSGKVQDLFVLIYFSDAFVEKMKKSSLKYENCSL